MFCVHTTMPEDQGELHNEAKNDQVLAFQAKYNADAFVEL
jgi:hypothetical protein